MKSKISGESEQICVSPEPLQLVHVALKKPVSESQIYWSCIGLTCASEQKNIKNPFCMIRLIFLFTVRCFHHLHHAFFAQLQPLFKEIFIVAISPSTNTDCSRAAQITSLSIDKYWYQSIFLWLSVQMHGNLMGCILTKKKEQNKKIQ